MTDLVAYLRLDRRSLLNQRMTAVALRLQELWPSDHGARQMGFKRLAEVFDRLRDALSRCATLDDEVLYPLVAMLEGDTALLPLAPDDLYGAVASARDGRQRLRLTLADLERAVGALLSPALPLELALLCADLDMLLLLIVDQLELEDRYLWPRLLEKPWHGI